MKILIHICCAPCAIFPLKFLRNEGFRIKGFFYRHNIHPYTECLKRQEALRLYAQDTNLDMIYQKGYELENFLQNIVFMESERCQYCYHERLKTTAYLAKQIRFDCFTTTLLYSKFQKHELIKSIGNSVAKVVGIPFYYEDFRTGWKEGVDESKRIGMYRQQYCGCIFSEKERYLTSSSLGGSSA